jgi:ABC-type lipoprotein release transport system permease subunit
VAAVWFRFNVEVRSRWKAWLGLIALIAISAGVVIFSLAGARRTETAWDRLARGSNAHDAFVIGQQFDFDLDAVRRLPEVVQAAPVVYVGGATDVSDPFALTPLAGVDGTFLGSMDRPKVIEGRRPNPDAVDEIAITPPVARNYGLSVGSTLLLRGYTPEQLQEVLTTGEAVQPAGPEVRLKVVGVEVSPNEGELVESVRSGDNLHLTPAFVRAYAGRIGMGPSLAVRLRHGAADQDSFKTGVERIAGGRPVQLTTQSDEGSKVRRALHTQALVLRTFAFVAGLAALLAVGQALGRQFSAEAGEHATLGALGMSRRQLWGVALLRATLTGLVGGALAVAIAIAASPAMPLGVARVAEPDPGVSVDTRVMGIGLVAVTVLSVALTGLHAWRGAVNAARTARSSGPAAPRARPAVPLAERFGRLGFPPTAVTGVRLALDRGSGDTAAPVRTTIIGTMVSVAALMTALAFGASLDHLLSSPRLYGWNWDLVVGNPFSRDLSADMIPRLRASQEVGGFSAVAATEVDVAGVRTQAYGFETVSGRVFPPITSGRAPEQPDEIVLGGKLLRRLDVGIGDLVPVGVGDTRRTFRVVGRGVFPQLSIYEIEALGNGALVTAEGLRRLVPEAQQNVFPVQVAAGADPDGARASLAERFHEQLGFDAPEPPLEIADFGRVDNMTAALSALLGLMAVASLAHALMTTVYRRRRELAVLKTLGFVRGQVRATVAWQASTMTILALAAGLPLGLAAARWCWRLFAENLGIVPEPVMPLGAALITGLVAVALANLVAAVPGRIAARSRPGLVLQAE